MAEATAVADRKPISSFKKWFLEGQVKEVEGPHEKEGQHHTHSWWQVMCLTGVDYFSTLGYQPSIAFVAAAALSPLATLIGPTEGDVGDEIDEIGDSFPDFADTAPTQAAATLTTIPVGVTTSGPAAIHP